MFIILGINTFFVVQNNNLDCFISHPYKSSSPIFAENLLYDYNLFKILDWKTTLPTLSIMFR